MKASYRTLTEHERAVINRLLDKDFPGKKTIRKQVESALVRTIPEYKDNYGSLEFSVKLEEKANVTNRIPISGRVNDSDGVPIEIFLHVINGKIDELEIVKADNSPLRQPIDASKITVTTDQEIVKDQT